MREMFFLLINALRFGPEETEVKLNSEEHWLLLQRTQVQFPVPI